MYVADAHLHAPFCKEEDFTFLTQNDGTYANCMYAACTCAHDRNEFFQAESIAKKIPGTFRLAFGLHPQNPLLENADFLQTLLEEKKICAIGECGFDLFTKEFKADIKRQEEAWHIQTELAQKFSVPIVVHNRKALDLMFRDVSILKKIPAVVFHSFAFGLREAESLLAKGINAWFSFGKPILNGNKKSIACVQNLSSERLMFETDAPYQTLKEEDRTLPSDILKVLARAAELRSCTTEEVSLFAFKNFNTVFCELP